MVSVPEQLNVYTYIYIIGITCIYIYCISYMCYVCLFFFIDYRLYGIVYLCYIIKCIISVLFTCNICIYIYILYVLYNMYIYIF